jgi:hypothetical protein
MSMNVDMPSMASSAYGSNTSTFGLANNGLLPVFNAGGIGVGQLANLQAQNFMNQPPTGAAQPPIVPNMPKPKKELPVMTARRLVQVFIADPDENVPLDQSMLYSGEQKLTDATDQELFFEIDIKSAIERHNADRIKIINKKVKERTEYLEPAKIRDLKMVVVNVATF